MELVNIIITESQYVSGICNLRKYYCLKVMLFCKGGTRHS